MIFDNFWKNLAKVQQGLQMTRTFGPRRQVQPTIDKKLLVSKYRNWVYIAANRVGSRSAQPALRLYATQGDADETIRAPHKVLGRRETKALMTKNTRVRTAEVVVEITEHPFIELWNQVNSYMTSRLFRNTTVQYAQVTGDAYWYIERDATGLPVDLHLLPSQLVAVIPGTGDTWVASYLFGDGPLESRVRFTSDEIVHFRLPNLLNSYVGMGRTEAVMASIRLNEEAKEYNIALNENMGVPSTILSLTDPTASKATAIKFKREYDRIMQGIRKSGNTFVHTGEISVDTLGTPIKDMQYLDGQKWCRMEVLNAFGVPLSLADVENVNKANAEAGDFQFEKFTIKPILADLEDGINDNIIPMYNEPDLFVAFDENVPENEEFELNKTTRLYSTGVISQDEARFRENYGEADPDAVYVIQGGTQISASGNVQDMANQNPDNQDNDQSQGEETTV